MSDIEKNIQDSINFDEDLKLIDESINEMDELYDEIKDHYDALKGSFAKGSLNFIQGQTSNLISLKTAKFNLIKERVSIKKIQEDLRLKNEASKGDQSGADQAVVTELLSKILKTSETDKTKIVDEPQSVDETDEELKKRLDSLINDGTIELTDNDERIRFEKMGAKLIIVKKGDKWKFAAVDSNNKRIKDYPLPDKSMYNISFKEDTHGNVTAVDEDNNNYIVKVIG